MASFQTFFRTVVMLATLGLIAKVWYHYGLSFDEMKSIGARVSEVAEEEWTKYWQKPADSSLADDPRLTAMGGPPVIIFFLALPSGVAVGRASLLVFFFFTSIISIVVQAGAGLMSWRVLALTLLMMPVMALGNGLGDRWFGKATDKHYRQVAMAFLLAIAVAAVARALVGLYS
jgi:hypothetical protein